MEFLELLEEIKPFIPVGYEWVTAAIDRFYPYLSFAFCLALCFWGLRLHHLWFACFSFAVGFFATALTGMFLLPSWNTYIFIAIGLAVGCLAVRFSHHLLKLQLFILNAFWVYVTLPAFLELWLQPPWPIVLALVAAVIAGLFTMRFKYITTILITACTGGYQVAQVVAHLVSLDIVVVSFVLRVVLTGLLTVMLATAGTLIQFANEKKHAHHKHTPAQPTEPPAPQPTTE